jgi:hypothetical protein
MRKLFAAALVVELLIVVAASLAGSPDRAAELKKADQAYFHSH